jgi:hypothetical protein
MTESIGPAALKFFPFPFVPTASFLLLLFECIFFSQALTYTYKPCLYKLLIAPVVIDEDIPHDGIQPRLDVCTNIVLLLVRQSTEKRFLEKVFGSLGVTG